jgi:putative spermidine/putrescine transport system permease protein
MSASAARAPRPGSGPGWINPSRAARLAVPGLFLALLLVVPLGWVAAFSAGYPRWDLRPFGRLLDNPAYFRVLTQSVQIAAVSTALALAIGYPVAYVIARMPPRWRGPALSIVLLPLWTSLLVRSYAWLVILGPAGPINRGLVFLGVLSQPAELVYNRVGTVIALVHSVLPYLVLPIYAACRAVDDGLPRAASSLGAGPLRSFLHVFLPLTLPGVGAGCLLAFVLGLGAFVIPALLGGRSERMIAMQIESSINQLIDWNLAAALAVVLVLVALGAILCQERVLGLGVVFGLPPAYERLTRLLGFWSQGASLLRRVLGLAPRGGPPARGPGSDEAAGAGPRPRRRRPRVPGHERVLRAVAAAGLVFLSLPVFVVIPISFSSGRYLQFPPPGLSLMWYARYLGSERWIQATGLSAGIALMVVGVALVIGMLAAWATVRDRFRGRGLLALACLAPMMLPNMVIAIALYFTFAPLNLVGTVAGLVLAHSLLALPMVFVTLSAGLRDLDPSLERAAAVLGASPVPALLRVVLPLLAPSMLAAGLFAFIVSFDEIVVSLFLTSVGVRTLPKVMWENIVMEIDPTISAVSSCLIVLSLLVVVGTQALQRGRRDARAGG